MRILPLLAIAALAGCSKPDPTPNALPPDTASGCNRIAGPYTVRGDSIRLGPLAMTRMACTEGMELETAFAAALDSASRYRRDGTRLELLRAAAVIARLES